MRKEIALIGYICMSAFLLADIESIVDESSLLKDRRIEIREYNTEKLRQALDDKGFITSVPVVKGNKIHIVSGTIEKIELEDESTNNPKLKSLLLGLNRLKGKVLNIRDIDRIIAAYNSLESNQVKVQIAPGTKPATSIIRIINKYTPKVSFWGLYDHDYKKEHNVTGVLSKEQIFGLNDKLSLYTILAKKDYYVATSYKIPFIFTDLTTSASYNYTKIGYIKSPKY